MRGILSEVHRDLRSDLVGGWKEMERGVVKRDAKGDGGAMVSSSWVVPLKRT